ncbi:hypothetical protein GCM10027578_23480 [Spirosoma luteolum]
MEDLPDTINSANDKLLRSEYAIHVSKIINSTVPSKAIAIAVIAEWGYGKTTFLNFIKSNLDKNSVVVNFNPWKFEKSGQMLSHFFEAIEDEFDDNDIISKIKDYSDKLTEIDDSKFSKIVKQSIEKLTGKEKSLKERYDSLNKAIIKSGKRLVVFIDDIDRLMSDELISIIRLIRNTADFSNTFFIAAFDQNYVLNTLANGKTYNNKENFLQKVFQLEITLPPIRKNIVEEALKNYLKLDSLPLLEKTRFERIFPNPDMDPFTGFFSASKRSSPKIFISQYLYNLRDVKRFVNSFQLAYVTIGSEVDLYDLFTLELIKYRFPSIYSLISEEKILIQLIRASKTWQFSEDNFKKYVNDITAASLNIPLNKIDYIKDNLKTLFDEEREQTSRSIIRAYNFNIYFFYQLAGSISISEFNTSLRKGESSLRDYFIKITNNKKLDEMIDYIDMIVTFENVKELKDVVRNLLLIHNYERAINQATVLIVRKQFNIDTYFENENDYDQFVKETLLSEDYDSLIRGKILHEILKFHLRNEDPKILEVQEVKQMLLTVMEETIKSEPENESKIKQLYTFNWDTVSSETRRINFHPSANLMMKSYLESHYTEFIKYAIRSKYTPPMENEYVFDPTIPQIFGSYSDFKIFLNELPNSACKKFLLEKFEEYEQNNYNSIIIDDIENNPCIK